MKLLIALAFVGAGGIAPGAQSLAPAFEVVSVRRNASGSFPVGPEGRPGGAFVATSVRLDSLIRFAYGLNEYQLAGGPDWMRSDRFDVEARAGRDVPPETLRRMVQALLEQRFQLAVRREQREMPIYTLVLARADGQPGPSLSQSPADCARPDGSGGTREERRTANGGVSTRRTCATIAALASSLSSTLSAPVDDRTTLAGAWDFELSFTGEARRGASPSAAARDPNEAPALFTALQEQLGLRLDSRRGPVDVLVIESAAQPTEN